MNPCFQYESVPALPDLKMVSQSAIWYFRNSWLNLCKSEISHQFTRHFGADTSLLGGLSQLIAYFGNASRQLLESLQALGNPIQISEKLVGHKDYVLLPWQQQVSRFFIRISVKISNSIQCMQKLSNFFLVLSIYIECGS